MKIITKIEEPVEPKGKRRIKSNIYGNIVGYIGKVRWIDWNNDADGRMDAEEWLNNG